MQTNDKIKMPQEDMLKEAEQATKYARDKAELAGVPLEKKIVKGHPANEILKAASDADLQATRVIRSCWPPENRPYIIAVTAFAPDYGSREMCFQAGMDD